MKSLESYNLEYPDRAYALSKLSDAFDPKKAEAIWDEHCKKLALDSSDESIPSLQLLYDNLSNAKGILGVYGMSLKVRLMTYQNLMKMKTAENA